MVVFTCNTCGDSLKKNQVEKHVYSKCRSCNMLTCIDCNKDFWGDAYKEHIKCVTEAERYGGKNFKPQVFKGEVKQQEWTELLSKIIETQGMAPPVREVFERMQNFNNVPRKEKPFKNFLQSSMGVRNPSLAQDVWQTIQKAQQLVQKRQPANKQSEKSLVTDENSSKNKKPQLSGNEESDQQQENGEPQDASGKESTPDKKRPQNGTVDEKVLTKKSKRELQDSTVNDVSDESAKKRKRKKRQQEDAVDCEGNTQNEEPTKKSKQQDQEADKEAEGGDELEDRVKFKWKKAVKVALLEADEHQLSRKLLRKRVFKECRKKGGHLSDEEMQAKFDKVLSNTRYFEHEGDAVRLVHLSQ
ncbi:uncharacterized protein LOC142566038 [Dermacentor variabilis]|uniref:uncharacterized protein LOC142566038 n=1 Tax=Dermacentor variabilis TaxID=34621 RepID=UPI003F5B2EBE